MSGGGVPNGWIRITVAELFRIVGGGTPPTSNESYWSGSIPWISSADIDDEHRIAIRRRISKDAVQNSATNVVPKDSVIVVTRVGLGKVAIAPEPMCFSQDSQALLFDQKFLDPRFVCLHMAFIAAGFRQISRGTTINGIIKKQLAESTFLLPPAKEQQRIVGEIEAFLTDLDAAVAALKRVQANLKRYRASVLKAACEGRLVPTEAEMARKEGRSYETGEQLLQRILRERRAKWEADQLAKMLASGKPPKNDDWKKKYKSPAPPDTTNLPALPEGWICVRLDTVADVIDPNPSHRTPGYVERGVAFVSAENFVSDSAIDFTIGRQVGEEVLREQTARFAILDGAFAMSRYGTVGKTCMLPSDRTYCLSYSLVVIQSSSPCVDSNYLRLVCSSNLIKALAQSRIQGASIPDLGVAHIRSLPIAIPVRAEQYRVRDEVGRKLSVVDQMTESVTTQLLRADRLRQAILKRAFEGKLVPQDPNDEPASVLLERIRAERAEEDRQKFTSREKQAKATHG